MASITWSVFVTAPSVMRYGSTAAGRKRLVKEIRDVGAKKVFLEVWRGGLAAEEDVLRHTRDAFVDAGIAVATGIMPVRGRDIALEGTAQWDNDTALGGNSRWGADICYSRPWSRDTLRGAMRVGAKLFDEFIIDDALCTQCTCPRCRENRGRRSWNEFRRDLLVEVCRDTLVGPCREVNPNIRMVLKYPQWYEQLAEFGYDTKRQPAEFDATWIGTETRDPDTPDYGYTPQYEACFNVRWHKSAEPLLDGAWFDYIECSASLYVEQAYQSVLGGARNLTLYQYGDTLFRQNGYLLAALKTAMPRLEALATRLDGQEPVGLVTYRPHNAPSHDDGYVFDGLGMIGLPLVPVAEWPANAPKAMLLTDHVAGDPKMTDMAESVVAAGGTVFITASLLAQHDDDARLKTLAGFEEDGWAQPNLWRTNRFFVGGREIDADRPVEFRFDLRPTSAEVLATVAGIAHHRAERIPVATRKAHLSGGAVVVLNVFGARPTDFRMDENLNVPIPLQMQFYPEEVLNAIQRQVGNAIGRTFLTPGRVAVYPFSSGDIVVENFTDETVFARPFGGEIAKGEREHLGIAEIVEKGEAFGVEGGTGTADVRGLRLPPRSIALIGKA